MIAALRKRHYLIWAVIGILIPVLAVIAYLKAPTIPTDEFASRKTTFPELLRSVVSENYVFNLKKNYAGGLMLEVMQISDINPTSELVTIKYSKNYSKKKTDAVMGMMGGDKIYQFNMKDVQIPFSVTVTDTIKHQILADISF